MNTPKTLHREKAQQAAMEDLHAKHDLLLQLGLGALLLGQQVLRNLISLGLGLGQNSGRASPDHFVWKALACFRLLV